MEEKNRTKKEKNWAKCWLWLVHKQQTGNRSTLFFLKRNIDKETSFCEATFQA